MSSGPRQDSTGPQDAAVKVTFGSGRRISTLQSLFTPDDGWGFVAFFRLVGFAGLILGVGLPFGARALIQHGANRESDVRQPPHMGL
jgi:hypothetical protein